MKLMEKMRQKRMGNKGFTLVELIIVIAIMAVLLGLVGTQIIPYLERSREAKDAQVLNSFSTAAVAAYSFHAEDFAKDTTYAAGSMEITGTDLLATISDTSTVKNKIMKDIQELTGYSDIDALKKAMSSKKGTGIAAGDITITIDPYAGDGDTAGTVTVKVTGFEDIISYIGETTAAEAP